MKNSKHMKTKLIFHNQFTLKPTTNPAIFPEAIQITAISQFRAPAN